VFLADSACLHDGIKPTSQSVLKYNMPGSERRHVVFPEILKLLLTLIFDCLTSEADNTDRK